MTDSIGMTERVAIMERLGDLFGGRVWRERVPRDVTLPRYDGLLLKPYLLIGFTTPTPTVEGRGLAVPESEQPHLLLTSTHVIGGHPDDVQAGINEVVGRLRDWSPNADNATRMKTYSSGKGDSRQPRYLPPVSFERVGWECILNSVSA